LEEGVVPWRLLHSACFLLRSQSALNEQGSPAWLHKLLRAGELHLPQPPRRQRNSELEMRLERLRSQAAEREYQALVEDVTRREASERERVPLSSAVREVGYGVHVLTVMATCFTAALVAGRSLSSDPGVQCAVGALGMLLALLVETGLHLIRDSRKQKES